MITIALDEGGRFENLRSSEKCMYIGGVVFQCKDDDARKKELERLQIFFKEICSSEGCKYPQDLHYNWFDNQVINPVIAEKVKNAIIASLPDFLNGTGKWASNAPKGKYYLHALVGDKNGINYFESNGLKKINELSNLLNDDISSNRYEHMAYRAIENLLFYNFRFQNMEDNHVRLNLATRVFKANDDAQLKKEALQTGHERHDKYESTFKATTLSSYRAALISMIQNSNRKDIYFDDIRVDSICYEDNPEVNFYHGFLYLSDIICNLYSSILEHCNRTDAGIEQLWQQCQQFVPKRVYVWAYNDFDQKYRAIYKSFLSKDYYKSLKEMYLISTTNEKTASVYDALWFDDIKKNVLFSSDENEFSYIEKSIESLENELNASKIKADESRYIFNFLKSKTEEICDKSDNEAKKYGLLYKLYKSELAICNHEGNPVASEEAFNQCQKYSRYVNVEDFTELQNMYSVKLCDSLKFEEAIEVTKKTCEYEDMLHTIKEEINPSETKYIHQGRTYSQLAQCYSFIEDYANAKENFNKAFECYGDDSFNKTITLSYYLHMLIEQKNKEEYEKIIKEYLGREILKEQLLDILSVDDIPSAFKLYVYMKALYVFYVDDLKNNSPKLLKELLSKFESVKKIGNKCNHPWEMIYKYAAFCCLKVGNKEYSDKAEEYIKLAKNINVDGGILHRIIDEIDTQYNSVKEGKSAFENSELTYMFR